MQLRAASPEQCLSAAGGLELSLPILQTPYCVDQAVIFFLLPVYLCTSWAWPSPNAFITVLEMGFLHCFSLSNWGAVQDPFSWRGTKAGHKCKDAQEGCATACSVFNCTASVASAWGFSVQGNIRRGCSRKCVLWDMWSVVSCKGSPQQQDQQRLAARRCWIHGMGSWGMYQQQLILLLC